MQRKYSLPSRIGAEELVDFLEQAAYHPDSTENELKMRFINPKEIANARRAALILGLAEEGEGKINPTELGRKIVYGDIEERQDLLLREVIMEFDPYEISVNRILSEHKEPFDIHPPDFEKIWSLHFKLNLSKDKLDRSAHTVLKFLDYCGIGGYLIGRRGKPTRLEMTQEGFNRLSRVISDRQAARREAVMLPSAGQPEGTPERRQREIFPPGPRPPQALGMDIAQGPSLDHQIHRSKDGSVILWIVPSKRSIEFLKLLLPVLEFEVKPAETETGTGVQKSPAAKDGSEWDIDIVGEEDEEGPKKKT